MYSDQALAVVVHYGNKELSDDQRRVYEYSLGEVREVAEATVKTRASGLRPKASAPVPVDGSEKITYSSVQIWCASVSWFLVGCLVMLVLMFAMNHARAFDDGQYVDVPENIRSWFKSVRSPHGVPCCDISDGHRTAYDIRSDGYWVPIEGEWRQVPPEAVVYNAGNPVGEAVVWYVRQGTSTYYIRCFVPGGGV